MFIQPKIVLYQGEKSNSEHIYKLHSNLNYLHLDKAVTLGRQGKGEQLIYSFSKQRVRQMLI